MKKKGTEYRFLIDAYSPETIPMARLAEYLADLSTMLGEQSSVHFVRIDEGSTVSVYRIDSEAEPKIELRTKMLRSNSAEPWAQKAYGRLNKKLADDNASGKIEALITGATIIEFPGRKGEAFGPMGPVTQTDEIDGVLIRIGGQGDPVPIHLMGHSGKLYVCETSRSKAREIARYYDGPPLRVIGNARWFRNLQGEWDLINFTIRDFVVLKDTKLADLLTEIRGMPTGLDKIADPLGDLEKIRQQG